MSNTLLFVDSQVTDYEALVAELGSDVEVYILNTEEDGVLQMANILQGRTDLDSIQIISHGSSGTLYLGSSILDSDNLSFYAELLKKIGSSLSATGDIMLYGCNVAYGDVGLQFIDGLAQYTGADVAASDDLTGNAALGGDWDLEKSTGLIEATIISSSAYAYTLSDPIFDVSIINPFGLADVGRNANPTFVDIDGDGDLDAFVGNGAGKTRFFENTGTASGAVFATAVIDPFGLTGVGFSASPSFADIDGDLDLDAFVGNSAGNILFFLNSGTANSAVFDVPLSNPFGLGNVGLAANPGLVDIDGDGDLDAFVGNSDGNVLFFQNTGTASNPVFAVAVTNPFGLTDVGSNANPTFADLDGDGDLDAAVGNKAGDMLFFRNLGSISSPAFAVPSINQFGLTNVVGTPPAAGYASPTFADLDGDGDLDAFVGNYDGNTLLHLNTASAVNIIQTNDSTKVTEGGSTDTYKIVLNHAPTADVTINIAPINSQVTTSVSTLTFTTANWNVAQTVIVTAIDDTVNEGKHTGVIQHTSMSADTNYNGIVINNVVVGISDNDLTVGDPTFHSSVPEPFGSTNAAPIFADIDGDGDLDAFVGNVYGNTLFYQNTGTANSPVFSAPSINPFGLANPVAPLDGREATPTFADIDGDGDLDAFIGNWAGNILFYQNTGTASSPAFAVPSTNPFGLANVGIGACLTFADIDGDGDLDVFVGHRMNNPLILFFLNTGTTNHAAFAAPSSNLFGITDVGYGAAPTFADIDGDGDLDAFVGNGSGNILFFRNIGTINSPFFAAPITNPFGLANVGNNAKPTFVDINADGCLDAFVGSYAAGTLFYLNAPLAGMSITQSGGNTAVTEGGVRDSYTVVLNRAPTADVTIILDTTNHQVTTSVSTLTFTTSNWHTAQTVTVTAVNDTIGEGTHTGAIAATASSADTDYNGIAISNVIVAINDNDLPVVNGASFNTPVTNPFNLSNVGSRANPVFADMDADGDLDVLVGNGAGDVLFYQNTGTASNPTFAAASTNPFGLTNIGAYASPTFADIDGDGDMDGFIGNRLGNTLFFQNTGTASSAAFAAPLTNTFGLSDVGSNASPSFSDIDNDGDLDAFVGNKSGDTLFFRNTSTANSAAFAAPSTNPFGLSNVGSYSSPSFADIDGDGDLDAFVGNGAGNTLFFRNTGTASNPVFAAAVSNPFGLTDAGSFASPSFADINADGSLDALVSNGAGNSLFYLNFNTAPTATNLNQTITYTEDFAQAIADLIITDPDVNAFTATIILAGGNSNIGSLTANSGNGEAYNTSSGAWTVTGTKAAVNAALAAVSFAPIENGSFNTSATVSISDGIASAITGTLNFNGSAVNDAPTATNLSAAESYTEDTALNLTDIVVADVDNTNVTVTLTLSNTAAGSLNSATSGAVTSGYDAGTEVWSASGLIANVNSLLAGLTFTPVANFNGNFTVTSSVSDGIAAPVTGVKNFTGVAVNDAPTATNRSTAETYTEDTALNLTDIVVSDIDSANVTATLTLSNPAAGSLNTATSGGVISTYSSGIWTASGAIANVNALLAGLTFTSTLNFNSSFSITTSISDGVAPALTGTKSLTGTAVNDEPTASNLNTAETYTEDTALNLTDIVASDVDGTSVSIALTLSNSAIGSFNTATSGAVTSTYTSNTGVWSASGLITDVNTLLASLTFTPTGNFNANFTVTTSISDGIAAAVTGIKNFTGITVNDAPTATNLNASDTYIINGVTNLTDIVVSDIDSANVTATLALSNPGAGILNTATSGTVTSTYHATTGIWSASGTIANVNALLTGLTFTAATDFNSDFSISTSVSDGVALAVTGTKNFTGIVVDIGGLNHAPTGTDNTLTILEDAPYSFTASDFGFADVYNNPANNLMRVIITSLPTNGSLKLNGLAIFENDAIHVANINAGFLVYTPTLNANGNNYASFSFKVQDDGGNLNGGVDTSSVAYTLTFNVTSVNDVPTLTTLNTPIKTGAEDDSQILVSFANLQTQGNEADIDGTVTAFVVKAVSSGSLKIGTDANSATAWAPGTNDVVDSGHNLYWTPATNASGSVNAFTVVAKDNDGAVSANPIQATVSISPVNDSPTGNVLITYNTYPTSPSAPPQQLEVLTADISTLTDADGINTGTITYQWKADGTSIDGATGSTYQLKRAQLDTTITVEVSYTDLQGNDETVTSAATAAVNKNYTNFNGLDYPAIDGLDLGEFKRDTLEGASGNDNVKGLLGNDVLYGYEGSDSLDGGADNDSLYGGDGNDYLVGGDGVGNDLLYGGEGNDTLRGGDGNDTIYGEGGDDLLDGGNDSDSLVGGNGNDTLDGGALDHQSDTMDGGVGNDTYYIYAINEDTISDSGSSSDVDEVIVFKTISYTLASGIENGKIDAGAGAANLTGNDAANYLEGNDTNNTLIGGAGNDTLESSGGNDNVDAGNGDDLIVGGSGTGNDTYAGGDGIDTIKYSSAVTNGITVNLTTGTATGNEIGTDTLTKDPITGLCEVENIIGGQKNDHLTGNASANSISGEAGNDTIIGGAGNDTLDGGASNDKLYGGAGNDSYYVDSIYDFVDERLSAALGGGIDNIYSLQSFNLSKATLVGISYIYFTSAVENLILTGVTAINGTGNARNNTLTGNSAANSLTGGAGNDTLDGQNGNDILNGGTGIDSMLGGLGDDTYIVDNPGDKVVENLSEGIDLVKSSITYTLSAEVENLTLTGIGAVNGTGNELANILTGNAAANILHGGLGADTLLGGYGNDTYIVDNANDIVTEIAAAGFDTVQSSVTYTLTTHVEKLLLTDNAAINGTGNSLANVLIGNGADNILDGGLGADKLSGGAGNDIYYVDNPYDVVTELTSNTGTDLINSSINFSLATLAAAGVENLTLTGSAIKGTGNALANILIGNGLANILNGGSGADTLQGGLGDDTYLVENSNDVVLEDASGGIDTVQSSAGHYVLSANVEKLTLTGTSAINGTGNELANILTGNAAANILDGGLGADTLLGGYGNDTYIVDNALDVITELAAAGLDTVKSSVSYTLATNVENLTLTGADAINGTGNALGNVLLGNDAGNILNGGLGNDTLTGGAGNDTLAGGAGKDIFRFTDLSSIDTLNDFSVIDDTIQLENAVFTSLVTTGVLNANFFIKATAAVDTNDYIIYDSSTGALFYDADGNGAGAAVQIAVLGANLALTNADFVVI